MPPNNPTPSLPLDWIHWFQQSDSLEQSFNESRWIDRVIRSSPAENPLLITQVANNRNAVAGYAILTRGALAVHGRLTNRKAADLEHSPCGIVQHLPVRNDALNTNSPKTSPIDDLQAQAVRNLISQAFAAGAEMYHAIEPLPSPPTLPAKHSVPHQPVFTQAGLRFITTLLRLEKPAPFPTPLPSTKQPPLRFEPYRNMPFEQWCNLIKAAYKNSLDVPEIEGARSIKQTLQGYAAHQPSHTDAWFSIWRLDVPIGSLILSIPDSHQAELTYLGLLPEFRSQGYGSEIMQFVMQWIQQQHIEFATLSVDCRNTPALRLYQRFGFQITEAYNAWACTPAWFAQPSPCES